jgi:hypothetical protein
MTDLVNGIYPKARNFKTPDYVLCKFSINVAQFREWMQKHLSENPGEEWVNIDCLLSKGGKPYAKLDTWKPVPRVELPKAQQPQSQPVADDIDGDIPF